MDGVMAGKKSECDRVRGMMSPYIDGRLPPGDLEWLEGHVEGCDHCRRELWALQQTVALVGSVPVVSPPRTFTLARVERRRGPAFAWVRAATAVAVFALAFLFAGDAVNLYGGGEVADRGELLSTQQPVYDDDEQEVPLQGDLEEAVGYPSALWPVEVAIAVVAAALAAVTITLWWRGRGEVVCPRAGTGGAVSGGDE